MSDETTKNASNTPKVKSCGMSASEAREQPRGWENISNRISSLLRLFWLLTESNAPTFVGPNTVFGICGALALPWMALDSAGAVHDAEPLRLALFRVITRLGHVILFNWTNLFIFDLANQRLPESAAEDALNKPWRPVPRGLVTADQIRYYMLCLIPLVVALNHFAFGVGVESLIIMALTWMYNDLRGGDEGYIVRNAIIAAAFGIYNTGSVKVALGTAAVRDSGLFGGLSSECVIWAGMVSAIIFTTMHVQDLQDVEGDRARGRRSAPIVMGDRPARWSVAVPMLVWPVASACFWRTGLAVGAPQAALGTLVAVRCLRCSGLQADKLTWRLWCLWTAMVYMLPPLSYGISAHVDGCLGG
ncbi:unnamed protein product [Clonostachys byssicola]|uniref:Uncharacterized protein n=1 Tax=Clonostachys byssicola TaxID=160290 RepID=A0A9N9U8I5_9HYPO|nr:unnamed protein product [Clonostachys byssicola]